MKTKHILVIAIGMIALTMSSCTTTSLIGQENTLGCTTSNYTIKSK